MITAHDKAEAIAACEQEPVNPLRWLCAWCRRAFMRGPDGKCMFIEPDVGIDSHGACPDCVEKFKAALQKMKDES